MSTMTNETEKPLGAGESEAPDYNPVFEQLVDKADHKLVGLVAYGLYKLAKREWIKAHIQKGGLAPTDHEYRA